MLIIYWDFLGQFNIHMISLRFGGCYDFMCSEFYACALYNFLTVHSKGNYALKLIYLLIIATKKQMYDVF